MWTVHTAHCLRGIFAMIGPLPAIAGGGIISIWPGLIPPIASGAYSPYDRPYHPSPQGAYSSYDLVSYHPSHRGHIRHMSRAHTAHRIREHICHVISPRRPQRCSGLIHMISPIPPIAGGIISIWQGSCRPSHPGAYLPCDRFPPPIASGGIACIVSIHTAHCLRGHVAM